VGEGECGKNGLFGLVDALTVLLLVVGSRPLLVSRLRTVIGGIPNWGSLPRFRKPCSLAALGIDIYIN
jgi:hypothetical protein